MSEVIRNTFVGMSATAAAIVLAVLVAMLVYTFLDECTKFDVDAVRICSIVAFAVMLTAGVLSALVTLFV